MSRVKSLKLTQEQTTLLNILKPFFLDKKLDPLVLVKGSKRQKSLYTTFFLKE